MVEYPNQDVYQSLEIEFILVISADKDDKEYYATFQINLY